jgi:hypothetical protein
MELPSFKRPPTHSGPPTFGDSSKPTKTKSKSTFVGNSADNVKEEDGSQATDSIKPPTSGNPVIDKQSTGDSNNMAIATGGTPVLSPKKLSRCPTPMSSLHAP